MGVPPVPEQVAKEVHGMRRQRLLAALDSPLSLVILEAVPGAGKRTLLTQWAAEATDEHRAAIFLDSPVSGTQLVQLVWAGLRAQTYLQLPTPPASHVELAKLAGEYARIRHRPITVAIGNADHLNEDTYGALLDLVDTQSNLRLIVSSFDARPLVEVAQRRKVAFAQLDDRAFELTLDEVRALFAEARLSPSPSAVQALLGASGGLIGVAAAVIAGRPRESELGTVSGAEAMNLFFAGIRLERWPTRIVEFVRILAHMPRFTVASAIRITREADAPSHVHRLQMIGQGNMVFDEELQQRVFVWNEPVRQSILQLASELDGGDPSLPERVLDVARETGDYKLEASILIQSGRLAEAEELCARWLWDLLPDRLEPLWRDLYAISPSALGGYPSLLLIRLRIAPVDSAAAAARAHAVARQLVEQASRAPQRRLAALARAADAARRANSGSLLQDILERARGLVADLREDDGQEASQPEVVSDLLLLSQTCLQRGDAVTSGWFSQHALELLSQDPSRLDPYDQRQAFAVRIIVYVARQRGEDDPLDGTYHLVGRANFGREASIVSSYLAAMWEALDTGEYEQAGSYLRIASEKVHDLGQWPGLVVLRAAGLALTPDADELRALIRRHGSSGKKPLPELPDTPFWSRVRDLSRWTLGEAGDGEEGDLPAAWAEAGNLLGQSLQGSPRQALADLLRDALQAGRAGRVREVSARLEQATRVLAKRGIAPVVFTLATQDEVQALRDLAAEVPGADALHLERAVFYDAQSKRRRSSPLSDRERELLGYLRRGFTNKDIAQAMFVSINTVKFHRANLLRKLEASSRDEAIEAAAFFGF